MNQFEAEYGDLNDLDKAFEKAAMGLPLTEMEIALIEKLQRDAAQRKETENVMQGAARQVAKKDEQTEDERQAERNAIEGAKERILEEYEDYKNLLNMTIDEASFLLNASEEEKNALQKEIDKKINKLLEDFEYRDQVKEKLVEGIKEVFEEEFSKFVRITGDGQDRGYAATHLALTFSGILKKGYKAVVKAVDADDLVKDTVDSKTLKKATEKISKEGVKFSGEFNAVATKQRRQHILYGDASGGGHLWPGLPGKSSFPKSWTPEKIMHEVSDIATDPNSIWKRTDGKTEFFYKSGKPARFTTISERNGVKIKVVLEPAGEGIITAHPI